MKIVKKYIALLFAGALTFGAQAQNEITIHDNRFNEDETIGLPEGMSSDIDDLLQQWCAKQYLYPDTTCQNPNVNPTYDEEVYRDRLARIPAVMEMSHNEVVQHFIDRYSNNLRRRVSYMLGAGNFYVPIFEEALDYYGLPLELKYLPVIESALDPTAVSPVGAAGLWQFMLTTAKRYNLEINSVVDERCDPIKSSYAAAHFLSDLYKIYGDWNLVIAAYNCGPGNVNKAIRRAGGLQDYWAIYPYLPKETRGYVPAFIAANYIMNYYCEHNICPMRTKLPVVTDTVMVNQDLHIDQIVAYCKVDRDAIKALNPQYRTDVIPGKSAPRILRLPQESVLLFVENQDSIYNYRRSELITRRGTVKVKNTPEENNKSKKTNAREKEQPAKQETPREVKPVREVREVKPVKEQKATRDNNENTSSRNEKSTSRNEKTSSRNEKSTSRNEKTSSRNEKSTSRNEKTSSRNEKSTSRNEKTSSRNEKSTNRDEKTSRRNEKTSSRNEKSSSRGDKKSTTTKKEKSTPRSVTVKSGDNLSVIAQRNGTTVSALKKANGLKDDKLKPGQVLKLK